MNKSLGRSKLVAFFAATMAAMMALCVLLAACGGAKSSLTLDKSSIELYVGQTVRLNATVSDENLEITWASDNESVVTVNRRGSVVGEGVGTATVTATLEDGTSASCAVTVKETKVTISQQTAEINLDDPVDRWTITLTAEASDGGAVTWESSDTSLATVSGGVVTATGNNIGDVTISAKFYGAEATCQVHIIQPSRPADWRLLSLTNNAETMANPGVWGYHADGESSVSYAQAPWYGGNAMGVSFVTAPDPAAGKYFYFRYQPIFNADREDPEAIEAEYGTEYVATFTIELSVDAVVRFGQATFKRDADGVKTDVKNYNTYKTANVKAGVPYEATYFGTLDNAEPFSIRVNECANLDGATFGVSNFSVRVRTPEDVEPEPDYPDAEQPGDAYDLEWADKATTVAHPNKWFYMVDSGAGKGQDEVAEAKFDHGTVTLSLNALTPGKTYQLRFQPWFETGYGTNFTATFTLNVSAQTDLLVGRDGATQLFTDLPVGEDIELTANGTVASNDPFYFQLKNFGEGPIVFVLKDVSFAVREEEEPPEPPTGAYDLTFATKQQTVDHPGTWFFMADGTDGTDYEFASTPHYSEDGVITYAFTRTSATDGEKPSAYQLRYQPVFEAGTAYVATFTVNVSANAWLIIGRDGATRNVQDLVAGEDKVVSYEGVVDAGSPFFIQLKGFDKDMPITLTVSAISFVEAEPAAGYDLELKTNGEVRSNPGKWFYHADDSSSVTFAEAPHFENGTPSVVFETAPDLASEKFFYFRYQPTFGLEQAYRVSFRITVDANVVVRYGQPNGSNDYSTFKTVSVTADTPVSVTYDGRVSDVEPFSIRIHELGEGTENLNGVSFTVSEISFTQAPAETEDSYDLTWGDKTTTVGNAGHWYYMIDTDGNGKNEINTAKYEDGVVTLDLKNTDAAKSFQLRYQPDLSVGAAYTVTFKVKVSAKAFIIVGRDGDTKNFPEGATSAEETSPRFDADTEYTVTYTGTVDAEIPFFIQLKALDVSAPIVLTVSEFVLTPVTAD